MGDHYRPTRFRALFAATLQAYTKSTGISLAEHPLTLQLQNCHSVESITALLQDQMQTFSNFGKNARLEGSIKSVVSILSTLSGTTPLDWAICLVRRRCFNGVFHIYHFTSRSHLKMRYMPVSQSYLLYDLSFSYILYIDVTSKCIRRPRASILAVMRLLTCSSQSHAFSIASLSIPKSPTQPPWMRWWSK